MRVAVSPAEPFLQAIRDTYLDLEGWRVRGETLEQPQPGSDLAGDDRVFPSMPISQLARMSLLSSGEHLRLAKDAIEVRQLYPTAHFTVLRGALVGAAQAIWVLGPDDRPTRQERGLTLSGELLKQSEIALNLDLKRPAATLTDQEIAAHKAWRTQRRNEVAAARTTSAKLEQTSIIHWALDYTFQDPGLQDAGRIWWRRMSSDAHVLGWALMQRTTIANTDRRTGLAQLNATGNLEDIANPYIACYRLLKNGWSLFDRRCDGAV